MRKGSERKQGTMPVGQDRTQHRRTHGTAGGAAPDPCMARGDNHGWTGRAIIGALGAFLLCAGLLPGGGMPAVAQATDGDPLVQRGIPAEATAENAVVARDRALASGQRIAYERMATLLGLPRNLPDAQIEAMVASLVIESERITPRGYSARITVNFHPPGGGRVTPQVPAPGRPGGPTVATLDAVATYRSLGEYIEIRRRLDASAAVARVELVTVAGDQARFRLGLRSAPPEAAAELDRGGLAFGPAQDPRLAGAWRIGLAGGR
jgi:hypothetical protein